MKIIKYDLKKRIWKLLTKSVKHKKHSPYTPTPTPRRHICKHHTKNWFSIPYPRISVDFKIFHMTPCLVKGLFCYFCHFLILSKDHFLFKILNFEIEILEIEILEIDLKVYPSKSEFTNFSEKALFLKT